MEDDDLSIPKFLLRKDTPEAQARREEINQELRLGHYRRAAQVRSTVSAGSSETNSKETKMAKIGKKEQALKDARAELKADNDKLAKAFASSLPGGKLAGMTPVGGEPHPDQVKKLAAKKLAAKPKTVAKVSDVTNIPNSEIFGTKDADQFGEKLDKAVKVEVKKANERIAKTAKKVAAKKPAAAPEKPAGKPAAKAKGDTPAAKAKPAGKAPKPSVDIRKDGLREGSKQSIMLDMVLRKEGASEKAICAKLGWKKCRVTLGRVVKRVGKKLESKKVGDVTTYFAK